MPAIVEVVAHRRRDRLRHPVERHQGEEEVARETSLERTAGIGPGSPLLQDPRGEAGRRIVQGVCQRLRLRGLDGAVAPLRFVPAPPLGEVSALRGGERSRTFAYPG